MNFQHPLIKKLFLFSARCLMPLTILPALLPFQLSARDGRALFEEAYRIEKSQPERAAGLYRSALDSGLPAELTKAARWRLFFLCRDQGWFLEAYETLKSLSHKDSIEESLLEEVKSQWGLKKEEFLALSRSLRGFRRGRSPTDEEMAALRLAYNAGTNKGKIELDRWLKDQGREALLIQLAAGDRTLSEAESAIRTASYWIDRNEGEKARNALEAQLRNEKATREERARLVYLLGRLERLEEHPDSAVYFRIAANYAEGRERSRLIALAAFSLYRNGQVEQAWALAGGLPDDSVDDAGMQLFLTVLAADARGDAKAIARLRAQEKGLKKQERGFLSGKALEILQRHPMD